MFPICKHVLPICKHLICQRTNVCVNLLDKTTFQRRQHQHMSLMIVIYKVLSWLFLNVRHCLTVSVDLLSKPCCFVEYNIMSNKKRPCPTTTADATTNVVDGTNVKRQRKKSTKRQGRKRNNTSKPVIIPYTHSQYTIPPPYNDHALGLREVVEPVCQFFTHAIVAIVADYACITWTLYERVLILGNWIVYDFGEIKTIYNDGTMQIKRCWPDHHESQKYLYVDGTSASVLRAPSSCRTNTVFAGYLSDHLTLRKFLNYHAPMWYVGASLPFTLEMESRVRRDYFFKEYLKRELLITNSNFQLRRVAWIIADYLIIPYKQQYIDITTVVTSTNNATTSITGKKRISKKKTMKRIVGSMSADEHLEDQMQRKFNTDPDMFSHTFDTLLEENRLYDGLI